MFSRGSPPSGSPRATVVRCPNGHRVSLLSAQETLSTLPGEGMARSYTCPEPGCAQTFQVRVKVVDRG